MLMLVAKKESETVVDDIQDSPAWTFLLCEFCFT
jgi:hypothetical protein